MYSDFLSLCGFETEEIKRESSRVAKAFEILEIETHDVKLAAERIARIFDVELLGIRKSLGVWLKELVDMVLSKEEGKKVVYASFPPIYQIVAAMASASEDVYCVIPEVVLCTTMNCIFNKINPILETAERSGLEPGLAFCSFLAARLGAVAKRIIPAPDLVVPSCLMCDQSPKVDELIHEVYGVPVSYIDHIFDSGEDNWPEVINPSRVRYLADELSNTAEKFGQMFGCQITEERISQAMNKEARLFNAAFKLWGMRQADPIPLRLRDHELAVRTASACSRRALREGPEALNILYHELKKRVKDGTGVLEKGAPRVMFSMVPFDPVILGMPEELGLAVSVTASVPTPSRHVTSSYASVWEEVAEMVMRRRGANYSASAYIHQVKELVKLHKLDGVVLYHHVGCRQYNTWLLKAKEAIEKELGIPVLILEGQYCDSRDYSAEQNRTRLEAFAEIVKAGQNSRKGNR